MCMSKEEREKEIEGACFALFIIDTVCVIKLNVYTFVCELGLHLPHFFPGPGSTSAWMCHTLLQPRESILPYMCLAGEVSWLSSTTRMDVQYTTPETHFKAVCTETSGATTS